VACITALFGALIYRQYRLSAMLVTANRIVEDSTTFLYHIGAGPTQPLTFISSNVAKLGYHPSELISSPDLYRGLIHQDDRGHVEDVLGQLSRVVVSSLPNFACALRKASIAGLRTA
jgi:hypothetical protein